MTVLVHPETGNPKSMTQLDATHPLKNCLIGICNGMIPRMDPMRALGLQGLFLSLASSLLASFAEKDYKNLRRARERTPKVSHSF